MRFLHLKMCNYRCSLVIYCFQERVHSLRSELAGIVLGDVVVLSGGVNDYEVRHGHHRHYYGVGQLGGAHPSKLEVLVESVTLLSETLHIIFKKILFGHPRNVETIVQGTKYVVEFTEVCV